MRHAPPYSSDQFPADFAAGLRSGVLVALICGIAGWYMSRLYLQHTYPLHPELLTSAVVVGCLDGPLIGLGAAVFTIAYRIWKRERLERKRSDDLLRLALEDVELERREGYED